MECDCRDQSMIKDTNAHDCAEGEERLVFERVEKGMSGTLLLQAFFWGDAIPQHTRGPAKGLK